MRYRLAAATIAGLASLLASCVTSSPASKPKAEPEPDPKPLTLHYESYALPGLSKADVELHKDGALFRNGAAVKPQPSNAKWKAFRAAVDKAGVKDWKKEYSDPHVSDGNSWRLDLKYRDVRKQTHGFNAYPGCPELFLSSSKKGDLEMCDLEKAPYGAFTKALEKLVGQKLWD